MKTVLDLYSEDFQLMKDFINNPTLENQSKLALSLSKWYGNRVTERPQESIELMPYFNSVCDKKNWKNSISGYCRAEDKDKIARAIAYFTATEAVFQAIGQGGEWFYVQAIGYGQGPAGGH